MKKHYMKKTFEELYQNLSDCTLCPRSCHVNRLAGQRGFCGEAGVLRAARAALYYTEEPVISGKNGSGTVFFSGCDLGCIYCQNRQISSPGTVGSVFTQLSSGEDPRGSKSSCAEDFRSCESLAAENPRGSGPLSAENLRSCGPSSAEDLQSREPLSADNIRISSLSPERLSEIFFELEAQGAHNINLVTPEHFVPLLIPALDRAKREGLSIPVVYNTGSYEKVDAVKALEGLVDVWLPDLKYVSPALSALHTGAADYFEYASAAIAEMVRQCPDPVFSDGSHAIDCPDDADDPLMIRGVLVRHLALPGCGEDSRAVLRYLHETYGDHIFISIMNQYTPMPQVLARKLEGDGSRDLSDLCLHLSEEEYDSLVDYAIEIGIENGFIQESGTVSPSYIPRFDGTGI